MWIYLVGIASVIISLIVVLRWRFNNFWLIAKNTTYIYEILRTDFGAHFPDEDTLLLTCGAIDAAHYVVKGQIRLSDIELGVKSACVGTITLDVASVPINNDFASLIYRNERDNLIAFVMQLEALIFCADNNMSTDTILRAVLSKRAFISRVVETTQHRFRRTGAPAKLRHKVDCFMTRSDLTAFRHQLGISDSASRDGK